ncbi:hypothetical protein LA080_014623 [Diaporthe eres]|nr:hypothetical protein LA080_014623 [Diaporthe eres]
MDREDRVRGTTTVSHGGTGTNWTDRSLRAAGPCKLIRNVYWAVGGGGDEQDEPAGSASWHVGPRVSDAWAGGRVEDWF